MTRLKVAVCEHNWLKTLKKQFIVLRNFIWIVCRVKIKITKINRRPSFFKNQKHSLVLWHLCYVSDPKMISNLIHRFNVLCYNVISRTEQKFVSITMCNKNNYYQFKMISSQKKMFFSSIQTFLKLIIILNFIKYFCLKQRWRTTMIKCTLLLWHVLKLQTKAVFTSSSAFGTNQKIFDSFRFKWIK